AEEAAANATQKQITEYASDFAENIIYPSHSRIITLLNFRRFHHPCPRRPLTHVDCAPFGYILFNMRNLLLIFLGFSALLAVTASLYGHQSASENAGRQAATAKPEDTEVWEPVPAIVTPGVTDSAPPSDAIVLFDGKNLDAWVSAQDHSPAKWI